MSLSHKRGKGKANLAARALRELRAAPPLLVELNGDLPQASTVEPSVGRPLGVQRLVATVEPGLYLVAACGAPPSRLAISASKSAKACSARSFTLAMVLGSTAAFSSSALMLDLMTSIG